MRTADHKNLNKHIYLSVLFILFVILTQVSCSPQNANTVQIQSPPPGRNLLLTNIPVPGDPEIAADFKFEYTGEVKDGAICKVLNSITIDSELFFKLDCDGENGWLPRGSVKIID
jgi:hypothetical protein